MGYRFGLFNYAAKNMVGCAEYDNFQFHDKILKLKEFK
jgi:hypothetical protein